MFAKVAMTLTRRTLVQFVLISFCCACIIVGTLLCILDNLKAGIALLIIGIVGGILVHCDRQCSPPSDTFPVAAPVVVVQKETTSGPNIGV